jgi:MFS family permease
MGLYAFFLAGSNYFAPVICGFIAEYQGWEWVFYWPAIFCGAAMIFLFFFMEETNYVREMPSMPEPAANSPVSAEQGGEKKALSADASSQSDPEVGVVYTKKTYFQKLSILGPRQARNNMLRRAWQTVYYLSWPVIFYAGYVYSNYWTVRIKVTNAGSFSYGSYLIWFNVLNGTASLILGSARYNFRYAQP